MFFTSKEPKEKGGENTSRIDIDKENIKSSDFMDSRLPYNYEYVIPSLLKELVNKRLISIDEARKIMRSGESYLH